MPFLDANGRLVTLDQFRERSNLVLCFSHGLECQDCQQLVEQFLARSQELGFVDAQVLIVQPSEVTGKSALPLPLHLVWDREGAAQRKFRAWIRQPMARDAILVIILDRYGAPQAACSVPHGAEGKLVAETLEYLTFIAIQCPE
ncbi:MAG: redoxin domain-containing protein [Anaerolineae bacterium]|nr:redoxin domain-containing protein [Anaerolineae bacterium]MDW8070165.1 hypothetical protein [Anaerolineae bacterium]